MASITISIPPSLPRILLTALLGTTAWVVPVAGGGLAMPPPTGAQEGSRAPGDSARAVPQPRPPIATEMGEAIRRARRGDYAGAIPFLEQALEKQPENARVLLLLGKASLQVGRTERARDVLARSVEVDPNDWMAQFLYANALLLLREGDYGLAAARRAARLEPANWSIPYLMGRIHVARGEAADGLRQFGKAEKLAPGSQAIRLAEARAYLALDRIDDAVAAYQDVLARDPRQTEALEGLAFLMVRAGKPEDAIALYGRLHEAGGESARSYYDLGRVYESLDRPVDAARCDQKAIALDPGAGLAHLRLGAFLSSNEEYGPARRHLERAARLLPEDPDVWYELGRLYVMTENAKRGREALQRALDLDPGHGNARFFLGFLDLLENESVGAASNFLETVEATPEQAVAYFYLGLIAQRQGALEEARRLYEKAAYLNPQAPRFRYNLGRVYLSLGEKEKGEEQLRIFKELNEEIRARIREELEAEQGGEG